jgi:hypothetical protein
MPQSRRDYRREALQLLKGENTMTQNQFADLCTQYGIHPSIALENDQLREALKARDDKKVIEILTNEF